MLSEPSLTREKSDQSGLDWRSHFEGLLSFRLLHLVLELRVPCLCDLGREGGGREGGGREGGRERGREGGEGGREGGREGGSECNYTCICTCR